MENYSSLGWLKNFLKLRNDTRSNLKNDNDNIDSSSDEEYKKDDMPAISDDDTGRMSDAGSNASERCVKRKMSPSMTNLKKAQAEIKAGPIWCQVVAQARKKSEKRTQPNRMIQQNFSKLLTNAFKKSQQFSQKK